MRFLQLQHDLYLWTSSTVLITGTMMVCLFCRPVSSLSLNWRQHRSGWKLCLMAVFMVEDNFLESFQKLVDNDVNRYTQSICTWAICSFHRSNFIVPVVSRSVTSETVLPLDFGADGDIILFRSIILQEVTERCYWLICVIVILERVVHVIWFGKQGFVVDYYLSLVPGFHVTWYLYGCSFCLVLVKELSFCLRVTESWLSCSGIRLQG